MAQFIFAYGDSILLLVVAAAVFDGARHFAIYGPGRRSYWTLLLSGVACFTVTLMLQRNYEAQSRPDPARIQRSTTAYPNADPEVAARLKAQAELSLAQRNFVDTGVIGEYTTESGQRMRYLPSADDVSQRDGVVADRAGRDASAEITRVKVRVWALFWLPVALVGLLLGRIEYLRLTKRHRFNRYVKPQTYSEVEGFVGLLKAACEDPAINQTLEVILSQSDAARKKMIGELLKRFRERRAPQMLIDAFVCLMDDEVAEKVYVFIHKCERPAVAMA